MFVKLRSDILLFFHIKLWSNKIFQIIWTNLEFHSQGQHRFEMLRNSCLTPPPKKKMVLILQTLAFFLHTVWLSCDALFIYFVVLVWIVKLKKIMSSKSTSSRKRVLNKKWNLQHSGSYGIWGYWMTPTVCAHLYRNYFFWWKTTM